MIDPYLHIHSHARAMLVEQVMAIHGRASKDPVRYRRLLEGMSGDALRHALAESDFPALEETTDDIHGALRRSGASTPAGILSQPSTTELSTAK